MFASCNELFPTKCSFVIFVLYISLFLGQGNRVQEIVPFGDKIIIFFSLIGILVTASQSDKNEYEYNIVTVVLMTEVIKMLASIGLYCKE